MFPGGESVGFCTEAPRDDVTEFCVAGGAASAWVSDLPCEGQGVGNGDSLYSRAVLAGVVVMSKNVPQTPSGP